MLILVILFYIIAAIFQASSLIKKNYTRELIAFLAFWVIAFVLSILYTLGIDIPSPVKPMQYIVENIFHLKYPK